MEHLLEKYSELGFASIIIVVFLWYIIHSLKSTTQINRDIFTMFKEEVRQIAECSKQSLDIVDRNKNKIDRIIDTTDANLKITKEIVNSQKEVARILEDIKKDKNKVGMGV